MEIEKAGFTPLLIQLATHTKAYGFAPRSTQLKLVLYSRLQSLSRLWLKICGATHIFLTPRSNP